MGDNLNPVEQVDQALLYIIGLSFILLLLITATMIYFVIRYRRSAHPISADIRGNWKLEFVWTVLPTLVVVSMFWIGWKSYTGLRNVPEGALEIDVIGQKYAWVFLYPNEKEMVNEFVVPLGKPVKLNITSEDVLHSFFLPAYRVKVDAVKGLETYAWFMADRLGEFDIHCAEYCGTGHARMNATLKIVDPSEYAVWLNSEEEDEDEESEKDNGDGGNEEY